eukprot:CAMPEP_0194400012 /NCGR_PEP_ID=MMETSP0174-20130528/126975_1 /TAXON_ID=216777 /ORGANISM="Proboscia alata, Strain PI-D3" /LENGTH=1182 /DNA_ID=CAMNT_0039196479 /DNA_START=217 /DNA_END=3766 /DNA_ORIENTATION=-
MSYGRYPKPNDGGPYASSSNNRRPPAPRGYVAGLGRGAAGFTTRSDIGPMASDATPLTSSIGGSRAAEVREAKLRMKAMQQSQGQGGGGQGQGVAPLPQMGPAMESAFGVAPKNYIPGAGRGAGSAADAREAAQGPRRSAGGGSYDQFGGYENDRLFGDASNYDDDDQEADSIYARIDERMGSKKRGKRQRTGVNNGNGTGVNGGSITNAQQPLISDQFRELKEKLSEVTEDQWEAIPDVGDYSLKYKQKRRQDVFTPLTDSLLEARSLNNSDATAGGTVALAGTATAVTDGFASVVTNMSGLAEARGTVLSMSLDKATDSVSGSTTIDPKGYLTSLSTIKIATSAEVGDVNKARLLLKSVRDTNPHHGPGWIAAARVEEAAGKLLAARKIVMEGCRVCGESEDVWLEAARLHPVEVGKTILATAARRIPTSVKIFLRASDLESTDASKKAVLRKGLESIPTSVTLWKAAIELEDAADARILLGVAVERVPHSVEMWLALARLESYDNARKVLNRARRNLPADRTVWIAAAKLEESQNREVVLINSIIGKGVKSLQKHDAVVSRSQWMKEAEAAEAAGAPLVSGAIVGHTVGMGVDTEDRMRTWSDDASAAISRSSIATARAILAHALASYPTKRTLWMQAVSLEQSHGSPQSLDEVLEAASQRLPRAEVFWLIRAKEQWRRNNIEGSRSILTRAFAANPDSESVWLAAAKLERETGEIERARVLLSRARERAGTERVFMKSALLERECGMLERSLELVDLGLRNFPGFDKLYMMGGQICDPTQNNTQTSSNTTAHNPTVTPMDTTTSIQSLQRSREQTSSNTTAHNPTNNPTATPMDTTTSIQSLQRSREYYQKGLKACPKSITLWKLAAHLEERAALQARKGYTKARSLLELARLKNSQNPILWVEAIRLERRASAATSQNSNGSKNNVHTHTANNKPAGILMAKALQECPLSGLLLSEHIRYSPRVEQKSKSADAIQKIPDDPLVICAVANLFGNDRKAAKARKWFERAVVLDPDWGDSWGWYYAFELGMERELSAVVSSNVDVASKEEEEVKVPAKKSEAVKERCIKADPKHGEIESTEMVRTGGGTGSRLGGFVGLDYAFELGMDRDAVSNVDVTSKEEGEVNVPVKKSEAIKERCIKADPKHGEIWCRIMKTMERRLTVGEGLERVATEMMDKSSN